MVFHLCLFSNSSRYKFPSLQVLIIVVDVGKRKILVKIVFGPLSLCFLLCYTPNQMLYIGVRARVRLRDDDLLTFCMFRGILPLTSNLDLVIIQRESFSSLDRN